MTPKKTGLLIAALILAAGGALYGWRVFRPSPPAAPGLSSAPERSAAGESAAGLPPLDQSDEFVRRRAAALSPAPPLREWLKLEALISRLAAAMNLIANGGMPRETFAAFAPRGKFRVIKAGGTARIDPAGFARYDAFAAMVDGVDAGAAAKIFAELQPLFDAAQRGLGEKARAREAFLAAARELLAAPAVPGDAVLKEGKKGIVWVYADERLEELSPAQKQLLRMGPKNQAAVQNKLRAVVTALGETP